MPPDRHYDVTREVDLIEEVGRVHGLDEHLPSTLPAVAGRVGGLSREQRLRRRAEDAMRDLGFDEVVGWSFTDPGEAERLRIDPDDPRADGIVLSNPLSEDQSVMRTTVLGSLLDVAQRNLAHGADRVAIFESGRVYLPRRRRAEIRNIRPEIGPSALCPVCFRGSGGHRTTSRTGSGALRWGRWWPSPGAVAVSPRTSSRSRGRSKRWPGSSAPSSLSSLPRSRSCTRVGPPA